MKKIIHVNQHTIKRNRRTGERAHPLSLKTYKSNEYSSRIEVEGPAAVVYRPDNPLPCGATVWIETKSECKHERTIIN
jgi:hypothetical protein